VPLSEIRDLSPRVATAYAQKTTKTLSRDLRYLVDAGLIALEPKGYRARRELILAFLPARVAGA
jgi:predicted transcriptional regulator